MKLRKLPRKQTDLQTKGVTYIFAYGAGFSGFLLLLLVIHALGLGHISRTVTFPYRVFFFIISILLVLSGLITRKMARIGRLWIPLLIFWALYFARVVYNGYLEPVPLIQPASEYLQKAAGMTFIPMFLFLFRLGTRENRLAFKSFWIIHLCCLAVAIGFYFRFIDESYRFLRYFGVDQSSLLSPISLSYIGLISSAIALQLLLQGGPINKVLRAISLVSIFICGVMLMLFGGTRSALLILVFVSLVIGIFGFKKDNVKRVILIVLLILTIGIQIFPIVERIGATTANRLSLLREQLVFRDPYAGGNRLEIYNAALKQVAEAPWLGSGLEIQEYQAFAHNSILEAFLATGVVGGISYVIIVCVTLLRCLYIFRYRSEYSWIAVLFIIYFARGLVSLSVTEPTLWFSMLGVLSVHIYPMRMERITQNGKTLA